MNIFSLYLKLGIEHILDLVGYDHILFLVTLCAVYSWIEWRKIIILITAFTIGHTTTLILATLKVLTIPTIYIEFLIPLTIFITAFANILIKQDSATQNFLRFKYFCAMFFGLIHGMGFSYYLRALLGKEQNIIPPLLSFNIGIEIGQILIILITFLIAWLLLKIKQITLRKWSLVLSGIGLVVSLLLMINRWPF